MINLQKKTCLLSLLRNASSATAYASKTPAAIATEMAGDNTRISCLTHPAVANGLSRLVCTVRGGSHLERKSSDKGLSHLIRRTFGQSTQNYTAVNLTRHFEQMGARVQVTGTREHLVYTVDCAPNLVPRAGALMMDMVSGTMFYDWELRDNVYKMMKTDIEFLRRHNLEAYCTELLHEAAFGSHPDGTLLGRSLFCQPDMVGAHSIEQIEAYMAETLVPGSVSLALVNPYAHGGSSDPLHDLRDVRKELKLRPSSGSSQATEKHAFTSGSDVRMDHSAAPGTLCMIASHAPSGRSDRAAHLGLAIAMRALNGAANGGRISWATDGLAQSRIFHYAYANHSLFGLAVFGSCGQATGEKVRASCDALFKMANSTGLSADQVARGKRLLQADLLMGGEDLKSTAVDLSLQMLERGEYVSPEQQAEEIEKMTPEQVNAVFKKVAGSKSCAMATVGRHTTYTPPLSVIMGK